MSGGLAVPTLSITFRVDIRAGLVDDRHGFEFTPVGFVKLLEM